MGNPDAIESDAPQSGPVARAGQECTDATPPPGRHDSSRADGASVLAADLRNPLAVVIANLQLLVELVARVQADAGRRIPLSPEVAGWLASHLAEVGDCLSDAHAAAERIREIVAPSAKATSR